ncbi:MAG: protein-tyrosine-phosphatase [Bacteroidia bacterium]|nr:protein-tyrosine-phosphatase [Bacteroidia bacterium]
MVFKAIETCLKEHTRRIPAARKRLLEDLAGIMVGKLKQNGECKLLFVCTHNSRRSHFGQIWARVCCDLFEIRGITTFSGGTEVTAFNPRAAAALRRAGFQISEPAGRNQPVEVVYSPDQLPLRVFSKPFNHPKNPLENAIGVFTCTDAEKNCPFIPGLSARISLPFKDPGLSDGTLNESITYDQICQEIATQMNFLAHKISGSFLP